MDTINNINIGTINNGCRNLTINVPPGTNPVDLVRAFMSDQAEDIPSSNTPSSSAATNESQSQPSSSAATNESQIPVSIIFTKKAKKEGKESDIIEALRKSVQGRKDKTRAFVEELHSWQNDGFVDAHYNAKVMYDELEKITPLSFSYDTFRKYYNNLI